MSRFTKTKHLIGFGLLAVASFIAAFFGLGLSYQYEATPQSAWGLFDRISPRDGWIVSGASIHPEHLYYRGNRMLLTMSPWRPGGHGPAHLRITVCGEREWEGLVQSKEPIVVSLKGTCEPRSVAFEVLNPFLGSADDTRRLGVQLRSMEITSRFGPPVVNAVYISETAAAIFVLSLIYFAVFHGWLSWLAAFSVPAAGFGLLMNARYLDPFRVYPLWLFLFALGIGFCLCRIFGKDLLVRYEAPACLHFKIDTWGWMALAAVLVGAILRFYGLDFGLPSNFHPDEVPKVNALMRMYDQHTLNPQYFLHPSLLLYLSYGMNWIFQYFGVDGTFRETAFLAGRTVSAIAGSLSIYLVYVIGRRLFSSGVGVFAGALLAVLPLHLTCSRYMKEDALLTAFILASTVAVIKACQENRKGLLLLAGLLAGFSASTKYSGVLTACIVGGAPWLRSRRLVPDKEFLAYTAFALALIPIGFLIATPYSILDSERFLRDFRSEQQHMVKGHTETIDAWSQFWVYHLGRSIVPGVSLFGTLLAVMGMAIVLYRRRMEDLFIVCALLLFYLPAEFVKAKPAPQPERYILPCLPFMALLIGEFLRVMRSSRAHLSAMVLTGFVLLAPAWRSLELSSEIGIDTRDQMALWMKQHLPKGSKIYADWKPYDPRFFNNEFEMDYIPRARMLSVLDAKKLRESDHDYLILSSLWYGRYFEQPRADQTMQAVIGQIFEQVPIVKQFRPKHGTYGFHNPSITLFSLDEAEFARLDRERSACAQGGLPHTSNETRASFNWGRLDRFKE